MKDINKKISRTVYREMEYYLLYIAILFLLEKLLFCTETLAQSFLSKGIGMLYIIIGFAYATCRPHYLEEKLYTRVPNIFSRIISVIWGFTPIAVLFVDYQEGKIFLLVGIIATILFCYYVAYYEKRYYIREQKEYQAYIKREQLFKGLILVENIPSKRLTKILTVFLWDKM